MQHFRDGEWKSSVTEVVNLIQKQAIKFVRLQFTDVNGIPKSLSVSTKRIESVFDDGQPFDGSSVTGYRPIEESDLVLFPDPSTFAIIPWRTESKATCRLICDIYSPNGERFSGDPRYALERALNECKKAKMVFKCAPELEFFILKETEDVKPTPIDIGGYFDLHPGDLTEELRREIADEAEAFGVEIEIAHHEVALGQNEIDFEYDEALETADRTVSMRIIVKSVAARNGYIATFMPKPFFGVNGSGMHVHQSLWSLDKRNLFFSEDANKNYISDTALKFIGGQLEYGRGMSAILASWPNSYKRLVPGYEAPVYIAWGYRNRSPLIRVPNFGGRSNAARVEIRCADPSGNPYLQLAVLCMSGLEGIKKNIMPSEPTDLNVYNLTYEERKKLKIQSLPESFGAALEEFEQSNLMKKILGAELFENFLLEKHKEWELYRAHVTEWEIERYLRKL